MTPPAAWVLVLPWGGVTLWGGGAAALALYLRLRQASRCLPLVYVRQYLSSPTLRTAPLLQVGGDVTLWGGGIVTLWGGGGGLSS
jgi:hypothetical protein